MSQHSPYRLLQRARENGLRAVRFEQRARVVAEPLPQPRIIFQP
jgi:hypothetical protein